MECGSGLWRDNERVTTLDLSDIVNETVVGEDRK